jgi:hypothetical protein
MPYTHGHAVINIWILSFLDRNKFCCTQPQKEESFNNPHPKKLWIYMFLGGIFPDLALLIFMLVEIPRHGGSTAFDIVYFQQPWQDIFGYFHSIPISFGGSSILFVILQCMNRYGTTLPPPKETTTDSTASNDLAAFQDQLHNSDANSNSSPNTVGQDVEGGNVNASTEDRAEKRIYVVVNALWLMFSSAFLHSFFDYWLHTDDAHSQMLPFSRYKFHSSVSYYNAAEYAWIWIPIEATLVALSCRFMLRGELRRWTRWMVYGIQVSYVVIVSATCVSAFLLI